MGDIWSRMALDLKRLFLRLEMNRNSFHKSALDRYHEFMFHAMMTKKEWRHFFSRSILWERKCLFKSLSTKKRLSHVHVAVLVGWSVGHCTGQSVLHSGELRE